MKLKEKGTCNLVKSKKVKSGKVNNKGAVFGLLLAFYEKIASSNDIYFLDFVISHYL